MVARFHSCLQQIKQHRVTILVVAIILVIAIGLIILGYRFDWTGFNGNHKSGKTLWDWLNLLGVLAVPVVVGFGAVWFTTRQGQVADEENRDNQRETALQAYIDKMSELLLEKELRDSAEEDEVRKIARVRTLTVLRGLDPIRKASVIQFLHESGLIDKDKCIISLSGADLSYANLREANLRRADLHFADFSEAVLSFAQFVESDLSEADLSGADLQGANLHRTSLCFTDLRRADLRFTYFGEADLSGAELTGADLREANLEDAIGITVKELEKQTTSLKGATMPDGVIHP